MHLLLLGSPTLQADDGHPYEFDTRKAMALLAYLALHDETFQRDKLAALFWPELDQSRARAALRRTLAPLNHALGEKGLLASRDTLALNPHFHLWVDSRAFETAANDLRPDVIARSHAHSETEPCDRCLTSLQTAVALYKGDFMAGFTLRDSPEFDNWQFFESDRLRRLYASTLERLIFIQIARGDLTPAIEHAQAWLSLDPLHEPAHRALMRLYAQTNQRATALRQYRECVRILDEELGVPPLEETKQMYEAILENRLIGESANRLTGASVTHSPANQPPVNQSGDLQSPTPNTPPSFPITQSFPLTGRTTELGLLLFIYSHPSPDGHFIAIEGEAGIGKTRLIEEFIGKVQALGALSLTARCYRGEEQLAYSPFTEGIRSVLNRPDAATRLTQIPSHWIAETSRLLPELASPHPSFDISQERSPLSSNQTRLFEGLRQLIFSLTAGHHPGVVFIDDIQWADAASLDLLIYLVRRLKDYPVMVVAAWRNEGDLTPLGGLLVESQRSGWGTKINLPRLTRAEVEQLGAQETSVSTEQLQTLYQETEGLPFFVVEYLSAARQQQDWTALRSVQDLERARLVGLNEPARQVLAAASVIGRSFEFDTLREVSGRSEEETITGLEALLSRGLLVEHYQAEDLAAFGTSSPAGVTPSYDFTHEKIRSVVYEDTSLARRRLLHRRVAEAILMQSRGAVEYAARIGHHYRRAGQDAQAARYFEQAGTYARSLYANTESLVHFQTALALGHPDASRLHEDIGDLQTLQGDYRAAGASYETAAALSKTDRVAQIEHKLGNLHHRRGDYALAASFFQSALEISNQPPGLQAQILADWSRTCARQGDIVRAVKLAENALTLSHQGVDLIPAGLAHNVLGMIARQEGDLARAADHLQQTLQIADAAHHLSAHIAALNNLALVYEDQGDYIHAVEMAQAALDLCTRLGDRHREAALRNRLADLFHASDQPSAAMYHLKKAVEIFAEIGGDPGGYEPEIWKLTEW